MDTQITETVFTFIREYVQQAGISPSLRDICDGCYLGRSTVLRHLDKLEAWGWIERQPGKARSIRVLKHPQLTP